MEAVLQGEKRTEKAGIAESEEVSRQKSDESKSEPHAGL